jgi:hypothetical protein
MPSTIAKIFIAALAASVATALPQGTPSAPSATPSPAMLDHSGSAGPEPAAPPAPKDSPKDYAPSAPAPPAAPAAPVETALIASLKTAPTTVDRFKLLLTGADGKLLSGADLAKRVVFDFNDNPTKSAGGAVKAANIANFPILTDLDIATTVAFLGPCGINTPHTHPRATEFLTVVDGAVDTGFVLENGFTMEVPATLKKFQGTVFPVGSIHYQVNNYCEPATFVATLNKADPGTSQIAQNFFALNKDVVNATLGFPGTLDGKDIEKFRATIPGNLALGIDKCLAKCNIKKTGY